MDELETIEAEWLVIWEEHLCFIRESRWCEASSGAMSTDGGQMSQYRPRPLITFMVRSQWRDNKLEHLFPPESRVVSF
jgi:hypothetical protein